MTRQPEIKITVNGRQALTYNLAAERHGTTPDAVRMALKRAGLVPVGKLERLPLFYATDVRDALKGRPGAGAPGVPRPHQRSKMAARLRAAAP